MPVILTAIVFSVIIGALIAFSVFSTYFRKRKLEIQSITGPEAAKSNQKSVRKPSGAKKSQLKSHSHSHAADKEANKKHHQLELNTLKGHGDVVSGLCFSPDGHSLATACGDGVIRIFRLDDVSSWSFKFLRINLPAGHHPTSVSFADDESCIVVASQALFGSSLYMYGEEKPKSSTDQNQQAKFSLPEIKWEHHKVHDQKFILTLVGTRATYGNADGSTILASCSEGTDIRLWHGKSGKDLGNVDTNQLKNTMATISPDGPFIAAAAFTADVKLKFGTIWNINVRYHQDEDPKTIKSFPIPLHDANGNTLQYDRLNLSPDGKILAATNGSTLQWLCAETGQVLHTARKAHDGDITEIKWAPTSIPCENKSIVILSTASTNKKVKLWAAPS